MVVPWLRPGSFTFLVSNGIARLLVTMRFSALGVAFVVLTALDGVTPLDGATVAVTAGAGVTVAVTAGVGVTVVVGAGSFNPQALSASSPPAANRTAMADLIGFSPTGIL